MAVVDFFERQAVSRRRTALLLALFALAVAAIIAATYLVVATSVVIALDRGGAAPLSLWNPELLLWVGGGTVLVVAGGSLYKLHQLRGGGPAVALLLGGRLVHGGTGDERERRLLDVVDEMAIASGVPAPLVYVLDRERGINAFAAGRTQDDAVVGVTRGALDHLDRAQLQGVLAHEFSHVLNGDMALNVRLLGVLHGILVIGLVGAHLLRGGVAVEGARRRRRGDGQGAGAILAVAVGLVAVGFLGVVFGNLIQAAVSRQREHLADAAAVQFTRNPQGLAGALRAIGGLRRGSTLNARHADEASHMFFAKGVRFGFASLFATHPPLAERIRRIDPWWDGTFAALAPTGVNERLASVDDDGPDAAERARREAALEAVTEVMAATAYGASAQSAAAIRRAAASGGEAAAPATTALLDDDGGSARPHGGTGAGGGGGGGGGGDGRTFAGGSAPAGGATLLDCIGTPGAAHLAHAAALLASIPHELRDAAHDSERASALVCALLLHAGGPDPAAAAARCEQLEQLGARGDGARTGPVEHLAAQLAALPDAARLPLVDLAVPALRALPRERWDALRADVELLARADGRLDPFEWMLERVLLRHVGAARGELPRPRTLYYALSRQLHRPCAVLLSALARVGHPGDEHGAARALALGDTILGRVRLALLPAEACGLDALGAALEVLVETAPAVKRRLVHACAACIAADHAVTAREVEVLRGVCDQLGVPVPPLLPGQRIA